MTKSYGYPHFSTTMVEVLLHKFATQTIESTRRASTSAERWICENLPSNLGEMTTLERKHTINRVVWNEWREGNIISADGVLYSKDAF